VAELQARRSGHIDQLEARGRLRDSESIAPQS